MPQLSFHIKSDFMYIASELNIKSIQKEMLGYDISNNSMSLY